MLPVNLSAIVLEYTGFRQVYCDAAPEWFGEAPAPLHLDTAYEFLREAVREDCLDNVLTMLAYGCDAGQAMCLAARYGRAEILRRVDALVRTRALSSAQGPTHSQSLRKAAGVWCDLSGDEATVKLVRSKWKISKSPAPPLATAFSQQAFDQKYYVPRGPPINLAAALAATNDIAGLTVLLSEHKRGRSIYAIRARDIAALCGHIAILELVRAFAPSTLDPDAIDSLLRLALTNGCVEVANWCQRQRGGAPVSGIMLSYAITSGQLGAVRWCIKHGAEISTDHVREIAHKGLPMLREYLQKWCPDSETLRQATAYVARHGSLDELRCCLDLGGDASAAMLEATCQERWDHVNECRKRGGRASLTTALHQVISENSPNLPDEIRDLLRRGAPADEYAVATAHVAGADDSEWLLLAAMRPEPNRGAPASRR